MCFFCAERENKITMQDSLEHLLCFGVNEIWDLTLFYFCHTQFLLVVCEYCATEPCERELQSSKWHTALTNRLKDITSEISIMTFIANPITQTSLWLIHDWICILQKYWCVDKALAKLKSITYYIISQDEQQWRFTTFQDSNASLMLIIKI